MAKVKDKTLTWVSNDLQSPLAPSLKLGILIHQNRESLKTSRQEIA